MPQNRVPPCGPERYEPDSCPYRRNPALVHMSAVRGEPENSRAAPLPPHLTPRRHGGVEIPQRRVSCTTEVCYPFPGGQEADQVRMKRRRVHHAARRRCSRLAARGARAAAAPDWRHDRPAGGSGIEKVTRGVPATARVRVKLRRRSTTTAQRGA